MFIFMFKKQVMKKITSFVYLLALQQNLQKIVKHFWQEVTGLTT